MSNRRIALPTLIFFSIITLSACVALPAMPGDSLPDTIPARSPLHVTAWPTRTPWPTMTARPSRTLDSMPTPTRTPWPTGTPLPPLRPTLRSDQIQAQGISTQSS